MKKKDIKIGMVVGLPRPATIIKIKGEQAKVRPPGENARWIKMADLHSIDD